MIINHYKQVRNRTTLICKPLSAEDAMVQVAHFASPAKWHLGHVTWFFEEFILKKYASRYTPYDEQFGFIFNSYYNSFGQRVERKNRGLISRPYLQQVYKYSAHVDTAMLDFLSKVDDVKIINLVTLGLHHEQQHQELLFTDIKYNLSFNQLFPTYDANNTFENTTNKNGGYSYIEEGLYEIGHQGHGFCYDNELGRHKVYLKETNISKKLVTNGEYIDFIENGGYENFNLWLEDGLYWLRKNNINAPLYWHKKDGKWYHFTLSGLKVVDYNAILTHVSFYEANAYAEYKKMRLPTEFEWEIAADKLQWGDRWEWTTSAYLPYPDYVKAKWAIGEYNGKFMNNQRVLRGASVATAKDHSRTTYRNFFCPEDRWQFNGIRLASNRTI